jgi:hypothetical protein
MEHILSLSYGKDSLACLEACKLLGYPIDRVIHAEVWATDTIPAELPPMIEFKAKADRIIKERYGLTVEHITAERERSCHSLNSSTPNASIKSSTENVYTDSLWCEEHGVIQSSKSDLSILTYERMFYTVPKKRKDPIYEGKPTGFPMLRHPWCNSKLKVDVLTKLAFLIAPLHKELTQMLCSISA